MTVPTKIVKTKLFIGNLDPAAQPSELSELFAAYGAVLEASVIKDYGFVHFGTIEEAEKAAAALNNREFHGKRLRVELSTSTVRHRPGQPEPASALRNSRARAAAMGTGNGVSRYSPAVPTGGVGPMRHTASAWARGDARPYDGMPMDPGAVPAGYGMPAPGYDRPRSFDMRADPRAFYGDRRDNGYGSGYDASRDNVYGMPGYAGAGGAGAGSGQADMYPVRDMQPPQVRADNGNYGGNRMYDRNAGASSTDAYYGGAMPQGPPAGHIDPYQNYDQYQKFYANRPPESEFPAMPGQNPSTREYEMYPNYRGDPYAAAAGQAPAAVRPDLSAQYQQQQQQQQQPQQAGFPASNQPRQPQPAVYGNAASAPAASYAPALAQYYGAQQRA